MDYLLLYLAQQTAELSTNSVYQILVGKRTAATLYFAFKHDLMAYFGLFPQLDKISWQEIVKQDQPLGLAGGADLTKQLIQSVLPHRQGLVVANNHYSRHLAFKLLIQSLSHVVAGQKQFVPLTNQLFIQKLIKEFFRYYQAEFQLSKLEIADQVLKNLSLLLETFDNTENNMLLLQLEGYQITAWTSDQIASEYELDEGFVTIIEGALLDRLITEILVELPASAPLNVFCQALIVAYPNWNDSVEMTKRMLIEGQNTAEIASRRHLKESTIADHFVEISLTKADILLPTILMLYQADKSDFLKQPPFDSYQEFQEDEAYGILPFWTYRYWQIFYQQFLRGGQDDSLPR